MAYCNDPNCDNPHCVPSKRNNLWDMLTPLVGIAVLIFAINYMVSVGYFDPVIELLDNRQQQPSINDTQPARIINESGAINDPQVGGGDPYTEDPNVGGGAPEVVYPTAIPLPTAVPPPTQVPVNTYGLPNAGPFTPDQQVLCESVFYALPEPQKSICAQQKRPVPAPTAAVNNLAEQYGLPDMGPYTPEQVMSCFALSGQGRINELPEHQRNLCNGYTGGN